MTIISIALSWAALAKQLFINLRGDMSKHKTPGNLIGFDYSVGVYLEGLGTFKGSGEQLEEVAIDSSIRTSMKNASALQQQSQAATLSATSQSKPKAQVDPMSLVAINDFIDGWSKSKCVMRKKHITTLPMFLESVGDISSIQAKSRSR